MPPTERCRSDTSHNASLTLVSVHTTRMYTASKTAAGGRDHRRSSARVLLASRVLARGTESFQGYESASKSMKLNSVSLQAGQRPVDVSGGGSTRRAPFTTCLRAKATPAKTADLCYRVSDLTDQPPAHRGKATTAKRREGLRPSKIAQVSLLHSRLNLVSH